MLPGTSGAHPRTLLAALPMHRIVQQYSDNDSFLFLFPFLIFFFLLECFFFPFFSFVGGGGSYQVAIANCVFVRSFVCFTASASLPMRSSELISSFPPFPFLPKDVFCHSSEISDGDALQVCPFLVPCVRSILPLPQRPMLLAHSLSTLVLTAFPPPCFSPPCRHPIPNPNQL